ncbi:MAG: VCBS repeat-containing protein [Verrucomicrobia bacterium]|nr:VCBS repeat-containing protein [Verrucomicrobiota bacterium]
MSQFRAAKTLFASNLLLMLAVCAHGDGGPGYALSFNPTSSVSVPHDSALNAYPITITAWIETVQTFAQAGIVTKATSPGAEGWQVDLDFGTLTALYQTPNGSVGSVGSPLAATGIADGVWHHVAFTVDATGGRLYVDGVQRDSRAWTGAPGPMSATTAVTLGNFPSGGNLYGYEGFLDEVTIWNTALTQSQVQSNMSRKLTGNEPGLLAYYRCDENAGSVLGDSAPLAGTNSGTLSGNVYFVPSDIRPFAPFVETLPPSGVNGPTPTFNGIVNPEGTNTVVWFQWGTTTNYGTTTAPQPVGNGILNTNFSQPLTGLSPGVYHFRAVASNSLQVVSGTNQTFERFAFYDAGFDLPGTLSGSVEWGDYDNDGRLDILLASVGTNGTAEIWRNTGTTFSNINAGLASANTNGYTNLTSARWVDFDNDGRLDVFLTGFATAALWRNTGTGFSKAVTFPVIPVGTIRGALGDYDNDGRTDVRVAANDTNTLWRNSIGGFYVPSQTVVPGQAVEPMLWGDFNNDGRFDFLFGAQLWRNIAEGNDAIFTNVPVPWPTFNAGANAAAWGDFNNDGLLDLLLMSVANNGTNSIQIWQNTGSGFTKFLELPEFSASSLAWGDYDGDGNLDFVVTGERSDYYQHYVTELWRNTGSGFSKIDTGLPGIRASAVAWGDYDNDGRLDLILSGATNSLYGTITRVFRNNTIASNTPPAAPTGLTFTVLGGEVGFAWNPATDAQTPSAGLTYNLRVGTAPGAGDVMTANAASNGKRRLSGMGNVQHNLFFPLRNLPVNQPLYASVQAVDTSFAGSPFSEKSFAFSLEVTPPTGPVSGDTDGDGIVSQAELDAVLANYWPYAPWLQMTNVAGLGGTNVTFSLSNSTAGAFSVEYSTNVVDWYFLGPAIPRYLFTDTNAPANPQRYYRLRWP